MEKLQGEFEEARRRSSVLSMVKDTLAAREFQSYVANVVLSEIVERANRLLDFLSDGRFSLSIDESGFVVRDGNVKRDANGLSGGEKTLVSIALAMSIAEEATGEMEAFFIDEGFSSLDSDNKSKVADALKKLERLNKVIGFVTHEPEFADYFERKLIVEKGGKLRWT
jgi:exonuclease SbcC